MHVHVTMLFHPKHHKLGEDRLEALVRISVEGPNPSVWDAIGAVQLWRDSKVRRQRYEARQAPYPDRSQTGRETEYVGYHETGLFSVTFEDSEEWAAAKKTNFTLDVVIHVSLL